MYSLKLHKFLTENNTQQIWIIRKIRMLSLFKEFNRTSTFFILKQKKKKRT